MQAVVTSDGAFVLGTATLRAALGYGGVRTDKREGDGATPAGLLPLRSVLFRADRGPAPACAVPVRAISTADGWCDDPASPHYNCLVRLPVNARAEPLWRNDAVYDIIGVLGWNDDPVQSGRGSAIFLHLARPDFRPTEGCVALLRDDLLRVLALGLIGILVMP